ncbi:Putative ribonuclease H protein At1g65750 [Linum grandiflorum]
MACITTPSFQVLVNGGCSATILPQRGLRQGFPLSPYLFTLCIQRLSNLIQFQVDRGAWKPIALARGSTKLSHTFFVDDLILFGEVSIAQAQIISECSDTFGALSGQSISKEKLKLFFSKNVGNQKQGDISATLGIPITQNLGRYLGIRILHGRSTVTHYKYILEHLDAKLAGWKCSSLSLAGRVTLATSVLNAIPAFAMQTSILPVTVCNNIDLQIRNFIWGSEEGHRRIHLVSWENICKPKEMGGMGLCSALEMNQAFTLKLAWGLLKRPKELWRMSF